MIRRTVLALALACLGISFANAQSQARFRETRALGPYQAEMVTVDAGQSIIAIRFLDKDKTIEIPPQNMPELTFEYMAPNRPRTVLAPQFIGTYAQVSVPAPENSSYTFMVSLSHDGTRYSANFLIQRKAGK